MNKLFIIGNGLDLASGIKSRYEDFIIHLINESMLGTDDVSRRTENELFDFEYSDIQFTERKTINNLNDLSGITQHYNYPYHGQKESGFAGWGRESYSRIKFKSKLFHKITGHNFNWSDLERTYFDLLIDLSSKYPGINEIRKLNSDFQFLKTKLMEYLKIVENDFTINSSISNVISNCLSENDFLINYYTNETKIILENRYSGITGNEVLFLNFNYTSILDKYTSSVQLPKHTFEILNIHGTLNDHGESVVFGYGDEMNEHFKRLGEMNNDSILEFFKSNNYHSNNRYHKMLDFLSDPYEVICLGHSLGLSDRVLLNTIMENDNCRAIHILHTGNKSHFWKGLALSRHFDNKKTLRSLLMPKNDLLCIT